MITPEFLMKLLRPVLETTKAGKALWRFENGAYVLPLTDEVRIAIQRSREGDSEEYSLKLLSAEHDVLGKLDLREKDPAYPVLQQLYQEAEQAFSSAVLAKVQKVVDAGGVLGLPTPDAILEPPDPRTVLPPEPTRQQQEAFFRMIDGHWNLDSPREQERVLIAGGSYRVLGKNGAAAVRTYPLSLLACSPDLARVELGKWRPDGTLYRIEVLKVSPDGMEGVVKHDLTPLRYTR